MRRSPSSRGGTTEKNRRIYLDPPPEVREAFDLKAGQVLQVLKAGFGCAHAPREWWQFFGKTADQVGANPLDNEPCFWVFRDTNTGQTIGAMILHAGDLMATAKLGHPECVKARLAVHGRLGWTPWGSGSFRAVRHQCGADHRRGPGWTKTTSASTSSRSR